MDELLSWSFEAAKAYIDKKLLTILFAISTGVLLIGCRSSQPIVTSQQEQIKKEVLTATSTKELEKSGAIIDSLKILIGEIKTAKPECDSITHAKISELLSRLNNHKSSGNNSFGSYYDKLKNELVIYANIAATQNERISDLQSKLISESQKSKEIKPIKYIPKEVKILAFLGLLLLLYLLFKILKPVLIWVGKQSLPLPW